jgi:MinD-like ATPase involved in chromosome partitioning or flagellar assembly
VTRERYVLLGLAPPRAPWFEAVARWTTSAAIAAEFVKCVSADEVRVRLTSGRRYSALLVDSTLPSLDRDLVDIALESLAQVIVVRSGPGPSFPAADLGVAAELPGDFSQDQLIDVLAAHCEMIGRGDRLPPVIDDPAAPLWLARMFTVCGPGGTGASTLAIALAQGLAGDARNGRRVLLADLARRADQSMLHDASDLGPGVQELVEGHRLGRPDPDEVRRSTFDVPRRGYRLLLGLRRPEAWGVLRPRAIDATIESVRRAFQVVVADVTGDLEGEADGGSMDVEERNHLARAAVLRSTVVVAVGAPGMKGVHSLAGLIRSLGQAGVPGGRIVAVLNRAPRNPRSRAESGRALAALLAGSGMALASPVPIPERKLEDALRDGAPLPSAVVSPLVRAVQAVAERQADAAPPVVAPTRVQPGSLGTWADPGIESGTA